MIKLTKLCFAFLVVFHVSAQEKTLNEITSFKTKNFGALMDKNNDVDGYYFYYEVDKLKKGQREYAIKMLDNNLNDIATKSYIDHKKTVLLKSGFNNQALMFLMMNSKDKHYKIVSFNRKAERQKDITFPVESKDKKYVIEAITSSNTSNYLHPIDNKGFLMVYPRTFKKLGYGLKYIATDGGKSWDITSDENSKEFFTINPIALNEKFIVCIRSAKTSMMSKKIRLDVVVFDTNTGTELFTKEFDRSEDPRLITNSFKTENDDIVVLGEYFKKGAKIFKDKSLGLFAQVLDTKGNVVLDKKISWSKEIDKKMPADSKGKKGRGYVYFHDIIRTQKGNYYCIGERYRKTVSGAGIASNILAAAAASSGGSGNFNSVTQLTITDAVVFEFDKDFNLVDIKNYEKGKSRAPSVTDYGSPQLNAHALRDFGAFDYLFTQIDTDRDRFYATFLDYERLKGQKNKSAFKAIIYNDNKLTEDKIYLKKDKGSTSLRVLPAKLGHVALMEYNKKKKTLNLHIEKLNIE